MQMSTASLLTAQQARTQTPAQPRAAQAKPADPDGFEEMLFGTKPAASAIVSNATNTPAQLKSTAPFARPGSQLDIKI